MRRIAVVMLAVAVFGAVGCLGVRTGPLRPAAPPVPPSQEIEVLDPGMGSTAVPPVLVGAGEDGVTRADVPPSVLVHRYYPTGDRSFQAQFLPGGPVVVAVNHPKTLERVYVPVTLPPGAPRVSYSGKSIVYDYGPQSVTLSFGLLGSPSVSYSQGTHFGERVRTVAENVTDRVAGLGQKVRVAERMSDLGERARAGDGLKRVAAAGNGLADRGAEAISTLRRTPSPVE